MGSVKNKPKRIIISVINDLVTDQRVHKTAQLLYNEGHDVLVIGRILPKSLPLKRDYKTCRMRLLLIKGPFFYIFFNIRLFFNLLLKKADILISNDLDTLLANYLISKIKNVKLVYDSHEIFTEVPELRNRPRVRHIWEWLEKYIFPKLTHVYTVNQSIATFYNHKYSVPVDVVRNIPPNLIKNNWPTRKDLKLPENKGIIILQGAGINVNRGAEEAILAMKYIEEALLLIIGGGDVFGELKILASQESLYDKVLFLDKMPYEQLMDYTHVADIGLSLDKDTNINYRYSLPNKLFDYIQAQVPILCSNLPEIANIVNTWQIGTTINSHNPIHIAETISSMLKNTDQYRIWKENLKKAALELNWDKESVNLLHIYSDILV